MKTTLRIARLELNTLFYSPIAWFLLIVFLFQCGLGYISILEDLLNNQELYPLSGSKGFLTARIFGYPFGILPALAEKLYLYLPLLTMGVISREISSGTIKLLYSSPIKIREIVFGKYLAMVVYSFLLTFIVALFAVAGLFNIESADYRLMLSGLLGIFVLLCSYSAIGLFMSCLTPYQVVAALSTLVTFAALSYIGTVWQDKDFVRDLTYFLSIADRTEKMLNGLITTKDLCYFTLIIFIFLGFSIYKLQSGRESKPWPVRAGRYVLIVVFALAIGTISSRPGLIGYYDATATQTNTLTENTRRIVREMADAPLQVTSYINLLEDHYYYGQPAMRNRDMNRWEPYTRFKPNIHFRYVYYYDSTMDGRLWKNNPGMSLGQIAEKYEKVYGIDPARMETPGQISQQIDLRPELNRYVMRLEYKGASTFLRLFDDVKVFPGETETSAALKRLTTRLPKIAFWQGELERSTDKSDDRDYRMLTRQITFRYALVNQGFDVEVIQPGEEIPADIAALVIADPRTAFAPEALTRIQQYIGHGGNLLMAGEPGKQSILNPVLRPLGVQLMTGTVVQESKNFGPEFVLPFLTDTAAAFSKLLKADFVDSLPIAMRGVAGLSYDSTGPFDIKPLLLTDGKKTWNKVAGLVSDSADIVYAPATGDQKAVLTTAVRMTRMINGKEQRIVVTGDADFLSNAEVSRRNLKTANFDFGTAIFGWLSYGQFPIDATRPKSKDLRLHLTGSGLSLLRVIFLGLLPGLLLLIGAALLIWRRRK
jgi:ABC-2 type transport system permease protein